MKKKLLSMLMLVAAVAMVFTSCSSSDDSTGDEPKLDAPQIVQHEQTSENPITLSFSWTAVGG